MTLKDRGQQKSKFKKLRIKLKTFQTISRRSQKILSLNDKIRSCLRQVQLTILPLSELKPELESRRAIVRKFLRQSKTWQMGWLNIFRRLRSKSYLRPNLSSSRDGSQSLWKLIEGLQKAEVEVLSQAELEFIKRWKPVGM